MCYPSAFAVGFGDATLRSNLGDVLRLQIPLSGAGENTLTESCIHSKVETLDGELIDVPRISITTPSGASQTAYLDLVTRKVMVEPAVRLSISMTCGGLVQRQYALLLDFPESPTAVQARTPLATPDNQMVPIQVEQKENPKPPRKAHVPRTVPAATVGNPPPETVAPPKSKGKKRHEAAAGQDALHVSNAEALPDMDLKLSQSLSDAAPATANTDQQRLAENKRAAAEFAAILRGEDPMVAAQSEIRKEQLKTQALQTELDKLKQQNALKEQEDKKFSPVLVGLIATLTALFLALIALVVVAFRKSRQNKDKTWWDQSTEQKKNVVDIVDYLQTTAEKGNLDPGPITTQRDTGTKEAASREEVHQPINKEEPAPKFKRMGLPALEDTNSSTFNFFGNRGHSIQIEEVSDITQEAEFWMSVNDPHRAIEILEPQSRDENQSTPVTWLYLLDLYRMVGDEDNYRDLRHRFKLKFNAKIPNFHEEIDPASIRYFEDFPHLISNCCALWHTDDIFGYLESLLVDDREGERVGFDLPVYRDILFLLSICNELKRTEHDSPKQKEEQIEVPPANETTLPVEPLQAETSHAEVESHEFSDSLNFDVLEFKTDGKDKH